MDSTTSSLLDSWIEEHSEAVYRAAWLISRDHHRAQDISQETFIKAARAASSLPATANVRAWLYRIATNTALNAHRSKTRELRAVSRLDRPGEVAPSDVETREVVRTALDELPEHLRAVVVAKYWMQLSEKQIAEAVGIKVGTVKSRLHAARQMLADELSPAMEGGA